MSSSSTITISNITFTLPPPAVPLNIICLTIASIGTLLSSTVIITLWRHRRFLTNSHFTLLNVILCDFCYGVCATFALSYRAVNPEVDMWWCRLTNFSNVFCATSIVSLGLMASERYLRIVHGKILTSWQIVRTLLGFWIGCLSFAIFPFVTAVTIIPGSSGLYCLGDSRQNKFPAKFYGLVGALAILCATIFTGVCYYLIYRKALQDGFKWKFGSSSQVNAAATGNIHSPSIVMNRLLSSDRTAYQQQLQLTRKLALITLLFFLGWSGSGFNLFYQVVTGDRLSPFADFILLALGLGNSIFNSMVILAMDTRWKWKFDRWRPFRKSKSQEIDSSDSQGNGYIMPSSRFLKC
ncbi:hypothetical protein BKA69DRAFT_61603 [Paraphysoderma sedebokerense]|nr:hypothetical protein BKA69DRAFT_61603 [Paraphysoderma sedebokerense]